LKVVDKQDARPGSRSRARITFTLEGSPAEVFAELDEASLDLELHDPQRHVPGGSAAS
jgi:predicted methyltransferase